MVSWLGNEGKYSWLCVRAVPPEMITRGKPRQPNNWSLSLRVAKRSQVSFNAKIKTVKQKLKRGLSAMAGKACWKRTTPFVDHPYLQYLLLGQSQTFQVLLALLPIFVLALCQILWFRHQCIFLSATQWTIHSCISSSHHINSALTGPFISALLLSAPCWNEKLSCSLFIHPYWIIK